MFGNLKRLVGPNQEGLDCQDARKLSSDYLEEAVTEGNAAKIRRHIEMCKACAAFFATLKATLHLIRSLPSRQAPESLRKRFNQ
ncbi:MAG: zf-HC2 domain-containing protein [Chloroflexi bacterium]|nr:zf-HC2 domain-containing protein [Chloroflexota bacterium]